MAIAGFMLVLAGCASLPANIISEPDVRLSDIKVVGLGFRNQTFLLTLDVHNPNPFALPVSHVSYGVRLDGQRFASGRTVSDISVPADGDARIAISVELDLLATAPQLLSVVRAGTRTELPYELEGQLGVNIPLTPPVGFRTRGTIRLNSSAY